MPKRCHRCGESKEETEFNKNLHHKDGLQTMCRDCNRQYLHEHYRKNKSDYIRKSAERERRLRQYIRDIKEKSACLYCGEDDPTCLDFHHSDSSTKEADIGKVVAYGWGEKRIDEEIAKCIILCSNCHRKLHDGIV